MRVHVPALWPSNLYCNRLTINPPAHTIHDGLPPITPRSSDSQIFSSRGFPSPDMAFGFVVLQYFFHFPGQITIQVRKSFGYILVYRALAHAKFGCYFSYGRPSFQNIMRNFHYPLLDVTPHRAAPFNIILSYNYVRQGDLMNQYTVIQGKYFMGSTLFCPNRIS